MENPLPDYFVLLANAYNTQEAADNFDLTADNGTEFDALLYEQLKTTINLINYVQRYGSQIVERLCGDDV